MSKDSRPIYYVYDVSRPDTGESCYIGKGGGGDGNRYLQSSSIGSNPYLCNIIKKYRRKGLAMVATIVRDKLTEDEAFATEIALIQAIGRKDQGKGPLANLTDGGEGTSGAHFKHSQESVERSALKRRGAKRSASTKILMSNKALERCAVLTKEERYKMTARALASISLEQRILNVMKAQTFVTKEQKLENAQKMNAALTPEKRRENSRGEKNGFAKLNWNRVREIRASNLTGVALAKIYGVHHSLISLIRHNEIWRENQN